MALRVIVGGKRTVLRQPASLIELNLAEIGPKGNEDADGTLYVDGSGWRLMDKQTEGYTTYDAGAATDHVLLPQNGTATLAVYDDGEVIDVPANQRWLQELGVAQGSQTTKGYYAVRKNAQKLGGLGSDWAAFPPPTEDEPVPLDRVLVGTGQVDGDDRTHVSFWTNGRGGSLLGPLFRYCFTGLAGTTRQDKIDGRKGTGRYAMTFRGDSVAVLRELTVLTANPAAPAKWRDRASFRYCPDNMVLGFTHSLTVETDAKRDAAGKLYGKSLKFVFSNIGVGGGFGQVLDAALDLSGAERSSPGILGSVETYGVPGVDPANQPIKAPVRIDARQDVALSFRASRLVYRPSGILRVQAVTLETAPEGGVFEVQAFGSLPEGTGMSIQAYGGTDGAACSVAEIVTPPTDRTARFVRFNAIDGERTYLAIITLTASADRLRSPSVQRVRLGRSAVFEVVDEPESEIANVTSLSTTPASADPSTETCGFECWDLGTDPVASNEILHKRAGMSVRVEIDLGPNPDDPRGPNLKSVLFRGKIVKAKRKRVAPKSKQGMALTGPDLRDRPLSRYAVQAVGECDALAKRLAPGRIDITFDSDVAGLEAGQVATYKVTTVIRELLGAVLPPERIDVPDLPLRFPLREGFKTYIERYTPIMPVVLTLVRDYLGGYLWRDDNAGDEGVWRVTLGAKRPFAPVAELCRQPIVSGVSPVHPAAYPDGDAIEGEGETTSTRKIRRTFMRQGPDDSWIERPRCNQVIVRGVGDMPATNEGGFLRIRAGIGALQVVMNNWPTAKFPVEKNADGTMPPKQGADGGPPTLDWNHPDTTDGEIVTLYHADPGLNTPEAVLFLANRLFDVNCNELAQSYGRAMRVLRREHVASEIPASKRTRFLASEAGSIIASSSALMTSSFVKDRGNNVKRHTLTRSTTDSTKRSNEPYSLTHFFLSLSPTSSPWATLLLTA